VVATKGLKLEESPQLNWRPQEYHKPAKELNRLGFQEPKSKKLLTFHPTESSPRTQTDAPNAIGKNSSAQILHSQIPTKQLMLMGE